MLKSAGHILVIVMLLFGTTGLSITRHYCGNSLVGTSVYSVTEKCCNEGCPGCHDENIKFRISDQFESFQSRMEFNTGFKTLTQLRSLPVLLAYSSGSDALVNKNTKVLRFIGSSPGHIAKVGATPSFLQVFLI